MRRILIKLNPSAEQTVNKLTKLGYTITDAVHMGLLLLDRDLPGPKEKTLLDKTKDAICKYFGTVENFCERFSIPNNVIYQVVYQIENGATIHGYDSKKPELIKTHTSWCVYCLKTYCHFDIVMENEI